jgi:O-antigen/teichoic acid export membrane protein
LESSSHQASIAPRRLANAGLILVVSQIVGTVVQVLTYRTIQSTLSKAENGDFFWAQQIGMLITTIVVEMGLGSVALRMVAQDEKNTDRIVATLFTMRSVLWLAAAMLIAGIGALQGIETLQLLSVFALYSLIGARSSLLRAVLEMPRRARNLPLVPALAGLLDIVLFALLVVLDKQPLTAFRAMLWMAIASVPGFLVMLLTDTQWRTLYAPFDNVLAKELFRETAPVLVSIVLMQIQDKSDTLALSIFCAKEQIGIYGAAIRIVAPLGMMLMIVSVVITPAVARLRVSNEALCKVYVAEGLKISLLGAIFCTVGICAVVEWVIYLSAGTQYMPYTLEFQFAAWSLIPIAAMAYILALLTALGEQRSLYPMMWVLCGTGIAGNLLLTPQFGVVGAIASKAISCLLSAVVGGFALQKFMQDERLNQLSQRFFGAMLIVGLSVVVIPNAVVALVGAGIGGIIVRVSSLMAVLVVTLVTTKLIRREDITFMRTTMMNKI